MTNRAFDARRSAREQAAANAIGFNILKPIMQFQVSLLRMWANNAELMARNYEQRLEMIFGSAVEEQREQQKAA